MNIALVDDELVCLQMIEAILMRDFSHFKIDSFLSTKALLESETIYDILLLDIEMPNEDGIQFAKEHYQRYQRVVFISSHNERVFDAFYMNITGFIPKDKIEEMLIPKINEIVIAIENNNYLKLRTKDGETRFNQNNILYFANEEQNIIAYLLQGRIPLTITSLRKLITQLEDDFILINRNVIINLNHIHMFSKHTHEITMVDDKIFTVSARKWSILLHKYNERVNSLC